MPIINWRLRKKLEPAHRHDPLFRDIKAMLDDDLNAYLKDEWTRAQELDGKLAKLTAALSLGLTLGGVASQIILEQIEPSMSRAVFLLFVVLAMISFLFGALLGFNGLRPKERYAYGPRYLNNIAGGGTNARSVKEDAAIGFMVTNIIRNNEASAAIDLVRNGIVFYGLAIVFSLMLAIADLSRHENYDGRNAASDVIEQNSTKTPLSDKELNDPYTITTVPNEGTNQYKIQLRTFEYRTKT